jgi:hypothetical protein
MIGSSGARLFAAVFACAAADAAQAETILFVGNSFTFGHLSPVQHYRTSTVHDLNGEGIGGVPALFKRFADESGLDYDVSLETHPGIGLDWHWANALSKIDRPWDHVVLQSYSTLDADHPGDPGLLVRDVARFAGVLSRRNPKVDIVLDATWSRADLTYATPSPWRGKPIFAMADDLSCAYRKAAAEAPEVKGVVETGEAFNRAIRAGVAESNPYDGAAAGQIDPKIDPKIDLWAVDDYHASTYGYYLEALMVFGKVTGRDPRPLGPGETAAAELGLSPEQAAALQRVAHDELVASSSGRDAERPAC